MGDDEADRISAEVRELLHRAAGDVAGLVIAAQVRQAARHLGYPPESWRVREGWHGRAGRWSAAALDDLRARFAAWQGREAAARSGPDDQHGRHALALRIAAIQQGIADLTRQVDGLAADIASRGG